MFPSFLRNNPGLINNIKVMPCVEGNISDSQPVTNSTAENQRVGVTVEGGHSDLLPSTQGMTVFMTPNVFCSLTLFIYVCWALKKHLLVRMASALRYDIKVVCNRKATIPQFLMVSAKVANTYILLYS